jgi:HEPN domain-containing protein
MSKIRQQNGDDYPEAALKHLEDAGILFREKRWDGSGYLAGYVVECVLKTFVLVEGSPVPGRHGLSELSQHALKLAASPGAKTAKYSFRQATGCSLYDGRRGWHPDRRYQPIGTIDSKSASEWLNEAKRIYEKAIIPMRLDGVL